VHVILCSAKRLSKDAGLVGGAVAVYPG